jgi:hypothetical protein
MYADYLYSTQYSIDPDTLAVTLLNFAPSGGIGDSISLYFEIPADSR